MQRYTFHQQHLSNIPLSDKFSTTNWMRTIVWFFLSSEAFLKCHIHAEVVKLSIKQDVLRIKFSGSINYLISQTHATRYLPAHHIRQAILTSYRDAWHKFSNIQINKNDTLSTEKAVWKLNTITFSPVSFQHLKKRNAALSNIFYRSLPIY